ncbi:MAG: Asp-tRNA(Asn)/Glu-tRNA(Gln) amidotransferase subunit GatB [Patescibacteria group bacterium]
MSSLDEYIVDGYLPTIGIECHVQFNTISKLFTAVDNDARDTAPNTTIGPLCVGLPGTLPVLNEVAVRKAIQAGLALNAEIAEVTRFDRKHYFYPDLPLGYQISQFDQPIVGEGQIPIQVDDNTRLIRIERAHLEADAGKLTHPDGANYSLVDLNRAGTPLLEIVSHPDMHSAAEAKAYARELYVRMLNAGVSDCDLFHGNIRFDVNVSVSKTGELGTRTETKNLNSFKNVERAVAHEIKRQIAELESGAEIAQETRGWDDAKQVTFSQRSKEDAHDYRYMPDPDIPPLRISRKMVEDIAATSNMSVDDMREKLQGLDLKGSVSETLIENPEPTRVLLQINDRSVATVVANWIAGPLVKLVADKELSWIDVASGIEGLQQLARLVAKDRLSSTNAKELLVDAVTSDVDIEQLADDRNLLQSNDTGELEQIIQQLITDNPDAAADAKEDPKAIGFFVGQVMKATQGKANPKLTQELVRKLLDL